MGASATSTDDSAVSTGTADVYPEADLHRLQGAVRVLLSGVGEDFSREGLRDTPKVLFQPPFSSIGTGKAVACWPSTQYHCCREWPRLGLTSRLATDRTFTGSLNSSTLISWLGSVWSVFNTIRVLYVAVSWGVLFFMSP